MKKDNLIKLTTLLLIDGIKGFLYFPLWWYSKGFLKILKVAFDFVKDFEKTLGLMIWVKNLFTPMFGQRDMVGKLISFFLRLFQIIVKSIILLLVIIIVLVFVLFWLVLPVFVIYQIIIHI